MIIKILQNIHKIFVGFIRNAFGTKHFPGSTFINTGSLRSRRE
jgi:hypothetical protein